MSRSAWLAAVVLASACQSEPALPASWQLGVEDVQQLVDEAVMRQPYDAVALDAAYRWAGMQGLVTATADYGWRLYAVSAYPDGHAALFDELTQAGEPAQPVLDRLCGGYSARGLLLDGARRAHPQLLQWVEQPDCARQPDRADLVLHWVEMVRLQPDRRRELEAGFGWLERTMLPADRARLRLAALLRDAGHAGRCRQALEVLAKVLPHDHEIERALRQCGA